MIAIACPYCQKTENVIKFGVISSGTPRARCKDCGRTFALPPRSRAHTPEKEQTILRHFCERTSTPSICRALRVSTNTLYATLKKPRSCQPCSWLDGGRLICRIWRGHDPASDGMSLFER